MPFFLTLALLLVLQMLGAQNSWTGNADTDWHNPANWSAGVPTATDFVFIPNVTNDPVILGGATAYATGVTVGAGGLLTINATGNLTMRTTLTNQGAVQNHGTISIGAVSGGGSYALYNQGTFSNNAGAEIKIDRSTLIGIYNLSGTFDNAAKITIGSIAGVGQYGIYTQAVFNNNSEGEIKIDRSTVIGLFNTGGTFTNAAKITIGATANVGQYGVVNQGVFNNITGGEISIDRCSVLGLRNGETFNNSAKITIGTLANIGQYGLENQNNPSTFNNYAGGEISINRSFSSGLYNEGDFNNASKITLGALMSVGTNGIENFGNFQNAPCDALVHIVSNSIVTNSGTYDNAGKMIENASGNSSISTNTGLVQNLNGGTFTIGSGNAPLTFSGTVSACCPVGNVLYVNAAATGANDGTSWADAYTDLQSALHSQCPDVTEIWVAQGVYKPTSGAGRSISFVMKNGIAIYGGFDGTEALLDDRDWTANVTTLSGNIGSPGNSDNSYHVIFNQFTSGDPLTSSAVLDGFTITGGNADAGFPDDSGAGMFNEFASPSVANCIFSGNSGVLGGAIYNSINSLSLTNCTISGNIGGAGGGIYAIQAQLSLINCLVSGNRAFNGGAISSLGYSHTLTNCTFSGNITENPSGGAISTTNPGTTTTIKNCILWGNCPKEIASDGGSTVAASYSIIQLPVGVFSGVGNLNLDPLFVTQPNCNSAPTTGGDLHLQACSPAIDAGTDTGAPANDLDGNPRPFDAAPNMPGTYDMGAYEYQELLNAVAVCQDITVQLDPDHTVTVPAADVNGGSTGCGALSFQVDEEASLAFDCDDEGEHVVTLIVTDAFNNTSDCVATITVTDDDNPCCAPPTAVCQVYTAVLSAGGSATIVPANVDGGSTYECGLLSIIVSPNTFTCANIGHQIVTLTVTDINGNSDACTATVTVVDNTPPSITCPNPVTVTCTSQIPAVNLVAVTATDNCGTPAKSHVGDATTNQTCANRKTVTRTYRATDASGNSSTCTQVITVFDNVKPNFIFVPANVTVQCNSVPAVGSPTANDGCGGTVTIVYNGQTVTNVVCTDKYTLIRQWTATDACGNTKTATQSITVTDTQKPNFTATPANVTVQCDAIPSVATPTATDNCDTAVAVTYNGQTQTNGACANAYTLTRRWTAADNCGNTKTVTQRITVVDTGKPVFTSLPANITIACNENPPVAGTPTASDGCGTATVTYLGQSTTSGNCPGNYQLKRTWRATDACGNSTVATQTIQILDNDEPVFTAAPADLTIQCGQALPPLLLPTASDACGYAFVTYLGQVASGSGCSQDYTVTRTWEAEDLCGNTASVSQVITVQGNNNAEEEGAESREQGAMATLNSKFKIQNSKVISLNLQPNPTTDRIWLDLTDFAGEAVTVSIFSGLGQLVWERSIPAVEEQKLSVSLRETGALTGIYTVSVLGSGGVVAKRVVLVE